MKYAGNAKDSWKKNRRVSIDIGTKLASLAASVNYN